MELADTRRQHDQRRQDHISQRAGSRGLPRRAQGRRLRGRERAGHRRRFTVRVTPPTRTPSGLARRPASTRPSTCASFCSRAGVDSGLVSPPAVLARHRILEPPIVTAGGSRERPARCASAPSSGALHVVPSASLPARSSARRSRAVRTPATSSASRSAPASNSPGRCWARSSAPRADPAPARTDSGRRTCEDVPGHAAGASRPAPHGRGRTEQLRGDRLPLLQDLIITYADAPAAYGPSRRSSQRLHDRASADRPPAASF